MKFFLKRQDEENDLFFISDEDYKSNTVSLPIRSNSLTAEEILSNMNGGAAEPDAPASEPLEALRRRMLSGREEPAFTPPAQPEIQINQQEPQGEEPADAPSRDPEPQEQIPMQTLLEKCTPYIVDENGHSAAKPEEPVYRLESVAEILKEEGDKPSYTAAVPEEEPLSREIYEEIRSAAAREPSAGLPDLSDIDNEVLPREPANPAASGDTATIRFTPIRSAADGGKMRVSTGTRPLDLTDELSPLFLPDAQEDDETYLQETEFEEFAPKEETDSPAEARRMIHKLSVKKRNAFLRILITLPLTLASAALLLPVFSDFLLHSTHGAMIYCTVLLGLSALCNLDMFASFRYLFSTRATADLNASLAAVGTLMLGGAAIARGVNRYELLLLGAVILLMRAIGKFLSVSATLGNLKQAAAPRAKQAVCLLNDQSTTFAMARNAIEGDALIAVPRPTERITGFMKYSEYLPFMNGRARIVALGSILLAAAAGPAAAVYFGRMIDGFYTAAAILCLAALPSLFLIDSLPLHRAAVRMNRKGCMLAGKAAAARLQMANAVTMSSHDIFPDGTVTLHNMSVLSENNFDETILRAAALTEAVDSPLTPIFKKIAGTNASYTMPDADTVKYEDRLGLSGWVDDELLFIGNRTLMEAHGIQVPSVELDRSILRRGYFPVYLATGGKACALLMVRYAVKPEVVYELRRLTGMGVTLLVNSCDPNMTEEMICDYLGLYSDSVHVMSNAGVHMYKNAVPKTESCAAPAAFRGNPLSLISIVNCASRIRRSNIALTAVYILSMCAGVVLFTYLSFAGSGELPHGITVLLYELISAAVAYLIYLFNKP